MNDLRLLCLSALALILLTGCGQTGALFLPGQGSGYYSTHTFDGAPKNSTAHKD